MKKSKVRIDTRDTTKCALRDEDGIMRNFSHAAVQANKLRIAREPDILKPIERSTNVCLVCREFSKYTNKCPTCKRDMFNFGISVKKVKKGSKRDWNLFIEAYAYNIYRLNKDIFPDSDIEKNMRMDKSVRYYSKQQCNDNSLIDLLHVWVHKFDKFLDSYRK